MNHRPREINRKKHLPVLLLFLESNVERDLFVKKRGRDETGVEQPYSCFVEVEDRFVGW